MSSLSSHLLAPAECPDACCSSYSHRPLRATHCLIAALVVPLFLMASTADAQDSSQWGSGKNLYEKVCGHCHKPEVGVGTALAGRNLPAAYVTVIVRNGLNGMPAFPASFISDEAIAQVAEYLATLPAPPAQP